MTAALTLYLQKISLIFRVKDPLCFPDFFQDIRCQLGHLHSYLLPCADEAFQLLLCAGGDFPALIHDHDAGTDLLHLFHVMCGVNNGSTVLIQLFDAFQNAVSALGGNGHCRLIHKDQLRLVCYAACNVQTP